MSAPPLPFSDGIRRGWPPPMAEWTPAMRDVFEVGRLKALRRGANDRLAWSEGWGAVARMPEGRVGSAS